MYCIKKFADCWAIFNLDSDTSRPLTVAEVKMLQKEIPSLNDTAVVSHFTDDVPCIQDKP
jgi:hypothetical protein